MTLFLIFLAYCAASVGYLFLLSVWGRFLYRKKVWALPPQATSKRIAVLVPAYKEDAVIAATAVNLLECDYPNDLYDIYIIADSFKPETLRELEKLPIHVLE